MHSAPSVTYPVGRSRFVGLLLLAAIGCGVGATVLAVFQVGGVFPVLSGGGVAIVIAAGSWAGLRWWHTAAGVLAWDGQDWNWSAGGNGHGSVVCREILVCLDLQTAVLLRRPLGGQASQWFWLERTSSPLHWDALRRAVYSPATREASAGALPAPQEQ